MARIISIVDQAIVPLPKFKKVAAYTRVSGAKDEMLHSLSAQVSYYSDLIQNHPGWEYAGVYSDRAYTGTKSARPDFERLIADCKKGKIDMVICKSITRFARNTVDTLVITRELKELGIDVFFEQEKIHSISQDGELLLSILASYAQEESRVVSENCKWRIRKKFKSGEIANLRFLYGYKISKNASGTVSIEIDEEDSAIVRLIFQQYASGIGCTKIAKMLQDLEIPKLRGGRWTSNSVRNILLNEKYTGNSLFQKKFVDDHLTKKQKRNHGELPMYYAENTHDAVVDKDLFSKTNEILEENRKKVKTSRKTPHKYEFTGLIKCGSCDKNYKRKIYQGKIYWSCSTYVTQGRDVCPSKQIPEEILKAKLKETAELSEIQQILVPEQGTILFCLKNGKQIKKTWQNKSRSHSWTPEMKEKAKIRATQNFLKKGESK